MRGTGALTRPVLDALPFTLTGSQTQAVADVTADMAKDERMLRLLQGDVGSGKTAVALMAMLAAVEAGGQAALMAPTEILARQHHATLSRMAAPAGITIDILTGRTKSRERDAVLERIASGETQIVIGTHALFQDTVAYHRLLLAVVDEQHRFGVHQRLRLTAKGVSPHMLVMTATPIPRTLVLAAFGDMDVSKLTEKPAGRKPIQTVTLPTERIGEMVERLRAAIAEGKKIYWICPLVEESEESDLMSAEERFQTLVAALGPVAGLVHGRMAGAEKDAAMLAFKSGETRLLVATTVVEVGVDVPDATIMVIEHAERFGLAQLHQLRGRVGRGDAASSCILLYKGPLSQTAHARLSILRDTEDGFVIAEEDLKLRGEGELLGTRQSGTPGFRLASLEAHADLLETARKDAAYIIERDPDLTTPAAKHSAPSSTSSAATRRSGSCERGEGVVVQETERKTLSGLPAISPTSGAETVGLLPARGAPSSADKSERPFRYRGQRFRRAVASGSLPPCEGDGRQPRGGFSAEAKEPETAPSAPRPLLLDHRRRRGSAAAAAGDGRALRRGDEADGDDELGGILRAHVERHDLFPLDENEEAGRRQPASAA